MQPSVDMGIRYKLWCLLFQSRMNKNSPTWHHCGTMASEGPIVKYAICVTRHSSSSQAFVLLLVSHQHSGHSHACLGRQKFGPGCAAPGATIAWHAGGSMQKETQSSSEHGSGRGPMTHSGLTALMNSSRRAPSSSAKMRPNSLQGGQ